MLSHEDNERVTRTDRGTEAGDLLRRHWQPVGLSREISAGGAPAAATVMGEDLVLFRDERGRPGLLGRRCAHRCADLSYGRVEDGGLRCLYHGWLYDVDGSCLEQPGEPRGSRFHAKIRQLAYPCTEAGGIVFAFLGPGTPPLFPHYEFVDLPAEHCYATKTFHGCNWLQGNEGNVDPVHTSFLHRMAEPVAPAAGEVAGTDRALQSILGADLAPQIELEPTDFGFRIFALRDVGVQRYVRVTSLVMPNASAFSGTTAQPRYGGYGMHWHVPIDDRHHWKYMIEFSRREPLDREFFEGFYEDEDLLAPDFHLVRNPANRYLQSEQEMHSESFSGVGPRFHVHDALAVESMGPIVDRSVEHLGYTDKAVIAYRRLLIEALDTLRSGADPPHVVRDGGANEFPGLSASKVIAADEDWRVVWATA